MIVSPTAASSMHPFVVSVCWSRAPCGSLLLGPRAAVAGLPRRQQCPNCHSALGESHRTPSGSAEPEAGTRCNMHLQGPAGWDPGDLVARR